MQQTIQKQKQTKFYFLQSLNWRIRLLLIFYVLIAGVTLYMTNAFLTDRFTQSIRNKSELRLTFYSGNLQSELQRNSIVPKLLAIAKNRTDTRIYVRGDKTINYGRVLEVMGTLSGAGFSKVALISEPYKN